VKEGEVRNMKAYMGYSRKAGSEDGACLVFAHNAKEARKLAWVQLAEWFDVEWIDVTTRKLVICGSTIWIKDYVNNGAKNVVDITKAG